MNDTQFLAQRLVVRAPRNFPEDHNNFVAAKKRAKLSPSPENLAYLRRQAGRYFQHFDFLPTYSERN